MTSALAFARRHRIDILIIVTLTLATLLVRIPIAAERKIMPAGDAFNFQHIASYIQYGQYPTKEKRLPAYPVFILLGRTAGLDPIQTSIGISIIASTGTILALYGLGRVCNFNRAALLGFLGLAIFDPLLIINGIRPLSDGLFVFFIATIFFLTALLLRFPNKATLGLRITYSIVVTFLMFTRYEGFLIAALTAPFLFTKLPWQQVAKMAALPIVAILLWIPAYASIHGSITGLSYVTDATNPDGGFGELSLLPDNFNRMMNGAGWKRVWAYPQEVFEKEISISTIITLLTESGWWVGVLSIVGLIYILFTGGIAGTSIILAVLGYTLLLSWWWVYSRYVAPLSIIFYLGAAGGMTALLYGVQILLKRIHPKTIVLANLVPLLCIPILLSQAVPLHSSALSRSWESNRKEYALYRAMTETAKKDGITVYPTREHANATLYFGVATEKKNAKNPAKGLYMSDFPEENEAALYETLAHKRPRFFIETNYDKRIPDLVTRMHKQKNIKNTFVYREARWDTYDIETTNVYELTWP